MLRHGESFWSAVYPLFMSRDLTRNDLRRIIEIGLEQTNGNYRSLVALFNMPSEDYKRFLGFLRKHNCHLPFQRFRTVSRPIARGVRGRSRLRDNADCRVTPRRWHSTSEPGAHRPPPVPIVIVDDDVSCLVAVEQILRHWGHETRTFRAFADARAYLAQASRRPSSSTSGWATTTACS